MKSDNPNIANIVISILGVKHLVVEDKNIFENEDDIGILIRSASQIGVNPDSDDQQKLITLFHEVIHRWNDYILGNRLKECDCEALAVAIYQLLADNENIMEFIEYVIGTYKPQFGIDYDEDKKGLTRKHNSGSRKPKGGKGND